MKLIQLTNQDLMFWEDNLTEFQGIELGDIIRKNWTGPLRKKNNNLMKR